jgi:catechol 2,3-dioxygenase-like lactoylglutathione lyase family enzyme
MPLATHHLALGAHDVERVAAFYREVFELPEVARHLHPDGRLRSIWLGLSSGVLMVEQSDAPGRRIEGIEPGLFMVAFGVQAGGHDEVLLRASRLLGRDDLVEQATTHTRYLRDPEGNRVAVSSYPLPGPHA